jgi:hypothetical protein
MVALVEQAQVQVLWRWRIISWNRQQQEILY